MQRMLPPLLLLLASCSAAAVSPPIQATAVPLGHEVVFSCRSETPAVWVKQSPDLASVEFLSHNGFPIDQSVDLDRFAFSKVGVDQYVLVVKSVRFSDAGLYKCSNVMTAALTVIGPPSCAPSLSSTALPEKRELASSCEVEFAGPAPGPRIDWRLGNATFKGPRGSPKRGSSSVYSNRTFVLTSDEHGALLSCIVAHAAWNDSIPKPECVVTESLNVTFKPRLDCPKKIVFQESDPRYEVNCNAYMNPVVHPDDIHWLLGNGNYSHALQNKTKYFNYKLSRVNMGYHILATLHKSLLSRATPTRQLTLHVFGPVRGIPTSVAISLELHHGPTIDCPENQKILAPSVVTVTCELFAYPSIPWENVTWRFGDRRYDLHRRRSTGFPNMRAIPGGVALALVADRDAAALANDEDVDSGEKKREKVSEEKGEEGEAKKEHNHDEDDNENEDYHSPYRPSYRDTYHVTLQVHLTNGTVEKNITVTATTDEDDGVGERRPHGPSVGLGGRGEAAPNPDVEDFFGIVEGAILTCFVLMLVLMLLLIFGLCRRQSEESIVKDPSSCCAWRRVSQYDEDDDEIDSYASRTAFHRRGFEGLGPIVPPEMGGADAVALGVPCSTPSLDYGDSSRCESRCDDDSACGALGFTLPRYGHAPRLPAMDARNGDVAHHF